MEKKISEIEDITLELYKVVPLMSIQETTIK